MTGLGQETRNLLLRQEWDVAAALAGSGPTTPEQLHALGLARAGAGRYAEAAVAIRRAVNASPSRAGWWRDLGVLCCALEQWDEAADAFLRSRTRRPDLLGRLIQALLRTDRVETAMEVASRLPGSADSVFGLTLLADALSARAQFHAECWLRRRIVECSGGDFAAIASLGVSEWACGHLVEAVSCFREVLRNFPEWPAVHSNLLTAMLHDHRETADSLRQEHAKWGEKHGREVAPAAEPPNQYNKVSRDPGRRLKVGYLGCEFGASPAFYFLFPIFQRHERSQVETFLYHSTAVNDWYTKQYRAVPDHWANVHGESTEAVCRRIQDDQIDILVDISGHFPGNRLDVFAQRPAPIQVTIPNYPSTTGLRAIDYIITDYLTCPDGAESQYIEKAEKLSCWYLPYRPPALAPRAQALPALSNGFITFGVFQRIAKTSPAFWDAAAEIMRRTTGSRLLIHSAWSNLDAQDDPMRQELSAELTKRGIAAERIQFKGPLRTREHLQLLSDVDIALDTFPYNGQTTTSECLWMGVPVVIMAGDHHVANVGAAILGHAGVDGWVAGDLTEYVDIAVSAAADLPRLQRLRKSLRQTLRKSGFAASDRPVRELEAAYRRMWIRWCSEEQIGEHAK